MKAQDIQAQGTQLQPGSQLFNDAVVQLDGQRERLGLRDDTAFLNTAASVAARAGSDGLQRIDHLVPNRDGDSLIAVQGRMDDPAHLRSHVQTASAANEPAQTNVSQLQQHNQQHTQQHTQQPAHPQEEQRRVIQQQAGPRKSAGRRSLHISRMWPSTLPCCQLQSLRARAPCTLLGRCVQWSVSQRLHVWPDRGPAWLTPGNEQSSGETDAA